MPGKRKGLSKRVRFEVFKRDGFKCQYCGATAPEAVLHVDHIAPVSKGGANDILNLVTSCASCNGGKGARTLDDSSAVERQRTQIEELQSRREQLEMMLQWRDGLKDLEETKTREVCNRIDACTPGWKVNDHGFTETGKLIKRFSVDVVLSAIDSAATAIAIDHDGKATAESVREFSRRYPRLAAVAYAEKRDPGVTELYYIRGILRKRCDDTVEWQALKLMKAARGAGVDVEELRQWAYEAYSFRQFRKWCENAIYGGAVE